MNLGESVGEKTPELLKAMEELDKAVETIRAGVGRIYTHLRISDNGVKVAENSPPGLQSVIADRITSLDRLKDNLYGANSSLEEIYTAIKEI
jgi:hypothetical protein